MADWLAVAKGLPYGQTTKIACCAGDRSCMVSHDAKGYRAWCFRCDPQTPIRFVAHGMRTLAELYSIRTAQSSMMQSKALSLPSDASPRLSPPGMAWLLSGGLSAALWTKYGILESPSLNRIILPMRSTTGQLSAVLLRSLSKDVKPKYLLRSENPDAPVVFRSRPDTILPSAYAAETVHAFDIVITEDVLSAVRVGRHTQAGALLGTAVDAVRVSTLLGDWREVQDNRLAWYADEGAVLRIGLWLDPDKAGRKGTRRLLTSLSLQGHTVVNIKTEKDPKFYSDNQIRNILLAGYSSS